jgi:hypothetical protein
LLAYENIFNDDLAGQTRQRKRARLLPAGIEPIMPEGYGEKFKDTLDDFLIASICGHFGVQPTEIGYSPKGGGLGGKGFEDGKAASADLIGIAPLVNWLGKQITNLSYTYLGMPRELEFKLMPSRKNDTQELAAKNDLELRGASKTINEARSEKGLPLLDLPEADMPMLVTGATTYLFSPDGVLDIKGLVGKEDPNAVPSESFGETPNATDVSANGTPEEETPNQDTGAQLRRDEMGDGIQSEVKAFMKWSKKGKHERQFEFKMIDPVVADALNRCAYEGDIETIKSLTKAYLS